MYVFILSYTALAVIFAPRVRVVERLLIVRTISISIVVVYSTYITELVMTLPSVRAWHNIRCPVVLFRVSCDDFLEIPMKLGLN